MTDGHGASHGWTSSDAWFAATLATIGRDTDLRDIIGAGDAINHAIFTVAEIEQAVQRLVGSGLMHEPDGGIYRLTEEGRSLVGSRKGGLIGQVSSVHKLLVTVPLSTKAWTIDPESLDAAFREYRRSWKRN